MALRHVFPKRNLPVVFSLFSPVFVAIVPQVRPNFGRTTLPI